MPRTVFHCAARYEGSGEGCENDLASRIEGLIGLDDSLRAVGERVCKEDAVWEVEIQPGLPVHQLLFDEQLGLLSRDVRSALSLAIDRAVSITQGELAMSEIQGALGPFPADGVTELNSEADWRGLVRIQLEAEPGVAEDFFADCCLAFPRLKFSQDFPDCIGTFDGGYAANSGVLVKALTALNDQWSIHESGDLKQILKIFSALCGFSTTMEGNGDRKGALTFTFKVDDKRSETVLCEPHMKLDASGAAGDNTFHFHRIYFNPRAHASFEGKVLVGHAGKHL